jgi:RHS repeat-associated protein
MRKWGKMSIWASKTRWLTAIWALLLLFSPLLAEDCLDSVDPAGGAFLLTETDLTIAAHSLAFEFTRTYDPQNSSAGPLGPGWNHAYNASVTPDPSGTMVIVKWGDGRTHNYLPDPNDPNAYYPAQNNVYDKLSKNPEGSWTVRTRARRRYEFDPAGKLLSIIDSNGNTISLTYGPNGLDTITDTAGRVIDLASDPAGLIQSLTDTGNRQILYGYTDGRLTSVTDARGNTQVYTYHGDTGLLATITDRAANLAVSNKYDEHERLIEQTNARGKTTKFAYNALNQLIDVNDPLGNHTSYTYDANGNRKSKTNPLGNTWHYKYDALDRLIEESDPLGNTTQYEYDSLGRKTALIDARGNRTEYEYDANDLLVAVTDALGGVTRYEYDPNGNMTAHIDATGKRRTKSYDSSGRLISEEYFYQMLEIIVTYEYDEAGNLAVKTDGVNRTTTYGYDEIGRAVGVEYPDPIGGILTYSYDENDNLVGMTDWSGQSTFEYDKLNRMTANTDSTGNRVEYESDAAGTRTAIVYHDGKRVNYAYDAAGRMKTITDWDNRITTYRHDAAGNLKWLELPNHAVGLYGYDDASRLTYVGNRDADGNDIGSFTYTLDPVGNRIAIRKTATFPLPYNPWSGYSITQYDYPANDWLMRLMHIDENPNESIFEQYDFSDFSNVGALQHISFINRGSFYAMYEHGPENRLWSFQRIPQWYTPDQVYGLNMYDGLGNRTATMTLFLYPGSDIYRQYVLDSAGSVSQVLYEKVQIAVPQSLNYNNYYIHGLGLVARIDPNAGEEYYYHYDGTGSTVALTDHNGLCIKKYVYDPFGEPEDEDDDDDDCDDDDDDDCDDDDDDEFQPYNPFKYVGRFGVVTERDGTLDMRTRRYHPGTGRFFSPNPYPGDPAAPMSLHQYVYSQNNPLRPFDLTAAGMDAPLPHMRKKTVKRK